MLAAITGQAQIRGDDMTKAKTTLASLKTILDKTYNRALDDAINLAESHLVVQGKEGYELTKVYRKNRRRGVQQRYAYSNAIRSLKRSES